MEKTIAEKLKVEMPYKWKIQGYNKKGDKAQCVAYIDARDLMDRLDEVMGIQNWRDSYRRDNSGRLICTLELKFNDEWIAKEDTGTEGNYEKEKSEFSDAFKRAGVKWGIGRFLYDMDIQWLDVKEVQEGERKVKRLYDGNVLVKSYQLTEYLNNKLKSKKD